MADYGLGQFTSSINFGAIGSQLMYWVAIILVLIVILIGGYFVYYITSFNVKASVYPIYGGANGSLSVGKPFSNRFKWVNNRTEWRVLWPLFNKKKVEPFGPEHMMEGNKVVCYKYGNDFIPAKFNVWSDHGELSPIPYHVQHWQAMEHKLNAQEFASDSWWDQNKAWVYMLIAVGICAVMTIVVVYFTYKFATASRADIGNFAGAVDRLANVLQAGGPKG